jgi:hypothetical protein
MWERVRCEEESKRLLERAALETRERCATGRQVGTCAPARWSGIRADCLCFLLPQRRNAALSAEPRSGASLASVLRTSSPASRAENQLLKGRGRRSKMARA